jgi:hypothetical protein
MNQMRLEKDTEITRLDKRNEDRRIKDNGIYRENQEMIRKHEKDIATYIKTISVLTQELDIRKDFERQYRETRAHCDTVEAAK